MKKIAYLFLVLFTMSMTLSSCRDTKKSPIEKVADDIEDAVD